MADTQESRSERAAVAVTPHEKRALWFMAGHRKSSESELLRNHPISDIVADYDRLMAKIEEVEAETEAVSDPAA